MTIVFDSSALLAIAFKERGAERAAEGLSEGVVSAVNASEVIACLLDEGVPEEEARPSMSDVISSLIAAIPVQDVPAVLDWKMVKEALATANGVPVAVASRLPPPAAGSGENAD